MLRVVSFLIDRQSFELHAQQQRGGGEGEVRAARSRSETRPEMMSALRELEEQARECVYKCVRADV